MTNHTRQLKTAYLRSGLGLLGISFERAMSVKPIRTALECSVKASSKGSSVPIQPALI